MNRIGRGRRLRLAVGAATLVVALTACGASTDAGSGPPAAGTAMPAAPPSVGTPGPTPTLREVLPVEVELALAPSEPVSLTIPKLDRESPLIQTGLRDDNTLEVPPNDEGSPASWYTGSPTPGETGAAVLLGHVNSLTDKSGVFYDLKLLEEGDEITVTREDGKTAIFEVYKNESYVKAEFPTKAVYYPVPGSELRLITCDAYDAANRLYANNLVVYAKLVDVA